MYSSQCPSTYIYNSLFTNPESLSPSSLNSSETPCVCVVKSSAGKSSDLVDCFNRLPAALITNDYQTFL